MPTENRSSNTEMVSVPRELLLKWQSTALEWKVDSIGVEIMHVLAAPAEQHQGEPVALPARKPEPTDTSDVFVDAGNESWNACLDEIAKLGPLYTRPAPEVQSRQPVAHCFLRKNGNGKWVNDASRWTDGPPEPDLLDVCKKNPELYRIRLAFESPADAGEVERLRQELRVARAQGRAEVVEMIICMSAEDGLDRFIGSHPIADTGDFGSHWEEEELRQHFKADPEAAGELELCRLGAYQVFHLEAEVKRLEGALTQALSRQADQGVELTAMTAKLAERDALSVERDRLIMEAFQLADLHLKGDAPNMADRTARALMAAIEKLPANSLSASAEPEVKS